MTKSVAFIGSFPNREALDQLRAVHGEELDIKDISSSITNSLSFKEEFRKIIKKSPRTVYVSGGVVSKEDIPLIARMTGLVFGHIKTSPHGKVVIHWFNIIPDRSVPCVLSDMMGLKAAKQLTIAMS